MASSARMFVMDMMEEWKYAEGYQWWVEVVSTSGDDVTLSYENEDYPDLSPEEFADMCEEFTGIYSPTAFLTFKDVNPISSSYCEITVRLSAGYP